MRTDFIIPVIIAGVILLAGGCAHKKKITPTPVPVQQQEDTEAAQRIEAERLEAERIAEQQRLEAERQRIQDSIAQAEAARKAMVQTMYISRMTITINMQGKQLTTPATLRWQRGVGAQISIQPFAGLEMFRMELDDRNLTVIDKINRRYTRLSYDDLSKMGTKTSIDEIDEWVDQNILDRRNEPQLSLQVSRAGISGKAVIYTSSLQTDVTVNMRAANVSGYNQVSLEQLVKGFSM